MKMNAIENDVKALVPKELEFANEQFPLFASVHEAFAVILEEVDEAGDQNAMIHGNLQPFWEHIKNNAPMDVLEADVRKIREHAVSLAIEAVQVAAMAEKFVLSFITPGAKGGVKYE